MQLEQRDKELAAIGASIGCNCRPCIEHHIPAGREAGLSEAELVEAVATARAVRDQAIELLAPTVDELLGVESSHFRPEPPIETSRGQVLAALGASIGANSHPLLQRRISAALGLGFGLAEVKAAAKMAAYVQQRASEMTADAARHGLDERDEQGGAGVGPNRAAPARSTARR